MSPHRDARPVLQAHLDAQRRELARRLRAIPCREHDSVHRARVATRRLRAVLRGYAPPLDGAAVGPVAEELRWLAGALGGARDLEVLHGRLEELLAGEPAGLVPDPFRTALVSSVVAREAVAEREVLAVLVSARCGDLLDGLGHLTDQPPWRPGTAEPAEVFPVGVRTAWERLQSRVVKAAAAAPDGRDPALHEVRKAARRLRYVTEVVPAELEVAEPAGAAAARRLATVARRMASTLGERQDTLVVRRHLLGLEAERALPGESSFVLGRLHAREEARARQLDRDFAELWDRASRDGGLLAWLG